MVSGTEFQHSYDGSGQGNSETKTPPKLTDEALPGPPGTDSSRPRTETKETPPSDMVGEAWAGMKDLVKATVPGADSVKDFGHLLLTNAGTKIDSVEDQVNKMIAGWGPEIAKLTDVDRLARLLLRVPTEHTNGTQSGSTERSRSNDGAIGQTRISERTEGAQAKGPPADAINQKQEEAFVVKDGTKFAITFPTPEQLRQAPTDQLEKQFNTNQAAITKLFAQSRDSIPLLAFHGADQAGINHILAQKEIVPKTDATTGAYVATISEKAQDAKTFLADLTRAANFASQYGKNGGVAVLDLSAETKAGHLAGVSVKRGAPVNPLLNSNEYFGETTIQLNPKNFDTEFKGVVKSRDDTFSAVPYDDSTPEAYKRWVVADAMKQQALVVDCLTAAGVLQPDQSKNSGTASSDTRVQAPIVTTPTSQTENVLTSVAGAPASQTENVLTSVAGAPTNLQGDTALNTDAGYERGSQFAPQNYTTSPIDSPGSYNSDSASASQADQIAQLTGAFDANANQSSDRIDSKALSIEINRRGQAFYDPPAEFAMPTSVHVDGDSTNRNGKRFVQLSLGDASGERAQLSLQVPPQFGDKDISVQTTPQGRIKIELVKESGKETNGDGSNNGTSPVLEKSLLRDMRAFDRHMQEQAELRAERLKAFAERKKDEAEREEKLAQIRQHELHVKAKAEEDKHRQRIRMR